MSQFKRVQIDPEKLIEAVKCRPMLYNKDNHDYHHSKKKKSQCWIEVCKEVVPDWGQFRPQERVECCHEIQKRWKSLRTCFGREISEQKREQTRLRKNLPIKRRKVYGYYNNLSFLLPHFNVGCRPRNIPEENESIEPEDSDDDDDPLDNTIKAEVFEREPHIDEAMVLDTDTFNQIYESTSNSEDKHKINVKKEEDDDDKQFLMSLAPTFKKFNDKQKFEAKIEILKLLKNISFTSEGGSTSEG